MLGNKALDNPVTAGGVETCNKIGAGTGQACSVADSLQQLRAEAMVGQVVDRVTLRRKAQAALLSYPLWVRGGNVL
jgi:hypothetical protein